MTTQVEDTKASGNTKPTLRGRSFQITIFELDKFEEWKEQLIKLKTLKYMLAYKEFAPSTGKDHIHVYIYFTQPYKYAKKLMEFNFHVEVCKGSPKQNIAYISKGGDKLFEYGEAPHQGYSTIADLRQMNYEDVLPQYARIKREIDAEAYETYKFEEMLDEIKYNKLRAPKIYYLTGHSGIGKTYKTLRLALHYYDKSEICDVQINNNFFKFTGRKKAEAKCHIVKEFRGSQLHASEFLQYTDKYGFSANTKGGFQYVRPEMIIIASIKDPTELYEKDEVTKQFTRRITKLYNLDYEMPEELLEDDENQKEEEDEEDEEGTPRSSPRSG